MVLDGNLEGVKRQSRIDTISGIVTDQNRQLSVSPKHSLAVTDDVTEPLCDSPLSLFLVVTLLTAEWICRKIIQLA